MGSSPGERKIKESQMEANREAGSKCHIRSSLELRPLPADTGASSREVLPITPRDLHWAGSQRRENGIHRKWPESNFQCGFPPSAWLYYRGEFDLPRIRRGVIKKLSFRHLPCTHLGRLLLLAGLGEEDYGASKSYQGLWVFRVLPYSVEAKSNQL